MVMGDDSCSKGRGFESRHRILDGDLDIDLLALFKKEYRLTLKGEV